MNKADLNCRKEQRNEERQPGVSKAARECVKWSWNEERERWNEEK
ncbi:MULTISPECIES: hypothetical protein [Pontibacillus]|uniref:Uncharacterized protein n=1 Tax=Pontibacillus chungwhensis TaxID=265426 RepID=A0ABY8V2V1_9BACI|nr:MULTISPECIES: hypothetical protein [Pontibacillus]WIF99582.1 hypothetical protein QNI29_07965 [Pontibacillus chungwhensis]